MMERDQVVFGMIYFPEVKANVDLILYLIGNHCWHEISLAVGLQFNGRRDLIGIRVEKLMDL